MEINFRDNSMREIKVGGYSRRKRILDIVKLSNGWYIIKTEDKSLRRILRLKLFFKQPHYSGL
jgi:hypothetical protein